MNALAHLRPRRMTNVVSPLGVSRDRFTWTAEQLIASRAIRCASSAEITSDGWHRDHPTKRRRPTDDDT